MSYGHVNNRDRRRKVALQNMEKQLDQTKDAKKVEKIKETLKNTKDNLGKGTSAMNKTENKPALEGAK